MGNLRHARRCRQGTGTLCQGVCRRHSGGERSVERVALVNGRGLRHPSLGSRGPRLRGALIRRPRGLIDDMMFAARILWVLTVVAPVVLALQPALANAQGQAAAARRAPTYEQRQEKIN